MPEINPASIFIAGNFIKNNYFSTVYFFAPARAGSLEEEIYFPHSHPFNFPFMFFSQTLF